MTNVKPAETFFFYQKHHPNTSFSLISHHRRTFGNCSSKYNVAGYKDVDEDKDSTLKVQNSFRTIDVYNWTILIPI